MADAPFDYERLLLPVSDEEPCGPDLRDEPDFRDLEDAPGEFANQTPQEIRKVVAQCDAMLGRTKDHLPAIVAFQAALRVGDFALAGQVLACLRGLTETYWEGFHPGPAEDMVVARINELGSLARPAAVALPVERAALAAMPGAGGPILNAAVLAAASAPVAEWSDEDQEALDSRVETGQVTAAAARAQQPTREAARALRAVMRTLSYAARAADMDAGIEAAELPGSEDGARALAEQLRGQVEASRVALGALSDGLYDLNAFYDDRAGDSAALGPALSALRGAAESADTFLAAFAPEAEEAAAEGGEAAAEGASSGGGSAAAARFVASVPRSRDDVVRAIDSIGSYYQQNEPSSPVPLMLARLRTWVAMDFLELMNEIAPGSLGEAQALLAIREE